MRCVIAVGVLLVTALVVPAAARAQALPPSPRFKTDTTAIVVDVIVRDKKGRPVTDLALDDFELREDGIGQVVRAMTLVAPDTPANASRRHTEPAFPPACPPSRAEKAWRRRATPSWRWCSTACRRRRVTSPTRRHSPTRSGRARPDDFVGVFQIDLSLKTLQTYTNDRTRLRTAIDTAARTPTSAFGRDASRVRPGALGDRNPLTSPTAGAESPGPATPGPTPPSTGPDAGAAAAQAAMDQHHRADGERLRADVAGAGRQRLHSRPARARHVARRLPGRRPWCTSPRASRFPMPSCIASTRSSSSPTSETSRSIPWMRQDSASRAARPRQAADCGTRPARRDIESRPDGVTQEAMGQSFDRAFTDIRSDPHAALDRLADRDRRVPRREHEQPGLRGSIGSRATAVSITCSPTRRPTASSTASTGESR